MRTENYNYILIAGCQRSGTTLLGQILGSQDRFLLVDEPDGVMDFVKLLASRAGERHGKLEECYAAARKKYADKSRFKADGNGRKFSTVVLKAPNATYLVDSLARSNHDIRVIFPLRDARDVACSMLRLPNIPMVENQVRRIRNSPGMGRRFARELEILERNDIPRIEKCAEVWKIKTSICRDFLASPLPAITIRYEDLVMSPDRQIPRLLKFCGREAAADQCEIHHEDVMRGRGPGLTMRMRPLDRAALFRWRRQLDHETEQRIWARCGELMTSLGYARFPQVEKNPGIDHHRLNRPVIALGRGGSGTRLLSELLGSLGVFLGNKLNGCFDSIEWADLIYEMAIKKWSHDDSTDWRREIRARAACILASREAAGDDQAWGWKLPETCLVLPEVLAAFERPRIIHLVRNPIDACLRRTHMTSRIDNQIGLATLRAAYRALKINQDPGSDPEHIRNAVSWRFQIELVETAIAESTAESKVIKYEDLCLNSDRAVHETAEFLGCELPLDIHISLPVDTGRMRKWKAGDPRAGEVWELCAEAAMRYGYAFSVEEQLNHIKCEN